MNDKELRFAVVAALDYQPGINSADVGVAVDTGVVTLTGHVKSYAEMLIVERAVSRVKGVRAIAMDLYIRYPSNHALTDAEIGGRAPQLLSWDVLVPRDCVTLEVEKRLGQAERQSPPALMKNASRAFLGAVDRSMRQM